MKGESPSKPILRGELLFYGIHSVSNWMTSGEDEGKGTDGVFGEFQGSAVREAAPAKQGIPLAELVNTSGIYS